jgi:DNA-binding transcriptional regulator PaaX
MKRKKWINYATLPGGGYKLDITEQGRLREMRARLEGLKINKPAKWDKKWRLVMFDIPESRRKSRSSLSRKLREMNFYQMQKSVWVHPYPCRKEIQLVKGALIIPNNCVIIADIEGIDNETQLRKQFAL